MSTGQASEETKCIVVKMPVSLVRKLEEYKVKADKSKNAALIELIEKGLNSS
jgi:hypothetical protein